MSANLQAFSQGLKNIPFEVANGEAVVEDVLDWKRNGKFFKKEIIPIKNPKQPLTPTASGAYWIGRSFRTLFVEIPGAVADVALQGVQSTFLTLELGLKAITGKELSYSLREKIKIVRKRTTIDFPKQAGVSLDLLDNKDKCPSLSKTYKHFLYSLFERQ